MSLRKNLNVNSHFHANCYRLRGQYQHSGLHICIQIVVQLLSSTNVDNIVTSSCRKFESIGMGT
jgi:hypothetical protein